MLLTPRYGSEPVLRLEAPTPDLAGALVRQQRRLAARLGDLDDAGWATASRCEGWSVQDVIAHLVTVDQFWSFSIASGVGGEPSRFLATFDPVATPVDLVAGFAGQSPAETLAQFDAAATALASTVTALDDAGWQALAEAPPGHLTVDLVVMHALWDSWIHERDVLLPLGIEPQVDPDEVAACLTYAAALGPAFAAAGGSTRQGVLEVRSSDPDHRVVIELGPSVTVHDRAVPDGSALLEGDAVALVEGLSFRAPLAAEVADADRWMLGGLDSVFDRTG